jgi:hypothetical protein
MPLVGFNAVGGCVVRCGAAGEMRSVATWALSEARSVGRR